MAVEEWARRIVAKELGRTVVINDDGSAPGMYDLRVGSADAPEVGIECVGAVDQTYAQTWNVGPAKGPLQVSIKGDWMVVIAPAALAQAMENDCRGRGTGHDRKDRHSRRPLSRGVL
jgi:hypothetical protein